MGNLSGTRDEELLFVEGDILCANQPPEMVPLSRLFAILVLATPLALWGALNNSLLLRYFGKGESRSSPTFYLAVLALLDTCICILYIALFGVDAVAIYHKINWLYDMYNLYCVPLFYCARVIQTSATYIILTATTERLIQNTSLIDNQKVQCITWAKTRYIIAVSIFLLSIFLHTPTLLELEVHTFPECNLTEFYRYTFINHTSFARGNVSFAYNTIVTPIVQIFVPFIALCILNLAIIQALKRQIALRERERKAKMTSQFTLKNKSPTLTAKSDGSTGIRHNGANREKTEEETKERNDEEQQEETALLEDRRENGQPAEKMADPMAAPMLAASFYQRRFMDQRDRESEQKKLQGATITLVVIAFSYLICNSLGLFVGILERLPDAPLITDGEKQTAFYTTSTDLLSILHMLNSFMRIFIYIACNPELRRALKSHYINIA